MQLRGRCRLCRFCRRLRVRRPLDTVVATNRSPAAPSIYTAYLYLPRCRALFFVACGARISSTFAREMRGAIIAGLGAAAVCLASPATRGAAKPLDLISSWKALAEEQQLACGEVESTTTTTTGG